MKNKYLFWIVCGITLILPAITVNFRIIEYPLLILWLLPGALFSWLAYKGYYGGSWGIVASLSLLFVGFLYLGIAGGLENAFSIMFIALPLIIVGVIVGLSFDISCFFMRNKMYSQVRRNVIYVFSALLALAISWVVVWLIFVKDLFY